MLSYNQNLGSYIQDLSNQKYSKSQPHYSPYEEERAGEIAKKKRATPKLSNKKKKVKGFKVATTKEKRRSNSVTLENRTEQREDQGSLLIDSPTTPQSEGSSDSAPFLLPQEVNSRLAYASNNNDMEMGIHFDVPPIAKEEQIDEDSPDYKKKLGKILKQGGQVNGMYYPLWRGEDYEFEL